MPSTPPRSASRALPVASFFAPLVIALALACGRGAGPIDAADVEGLVFLDEPSPIITPGHDDALNVRPWFHDFGRVRMGTELEHTFRVKNTGDVPITVHDLLASCGCAVPAIAATSADGRRIQGRPDGESPRIVLPPGSIAELTVRIDTSNEREANHDKLLTVRMRSDAANLPFASFELHVLPIKLFQVTPPAIELGRVPASVSVSGEAVIVLAAADTDVRPSGALSVEGPLEARIDAVEVLGKRGWRLMVESEPGLPAGALVGAVHVELAGRDAGDESLVVPVRGRVVLDLVLDPGAFHLARAEEGLFAEVRLIALVPGSRVRVLGLAAEGQGAEALELTAEPVDPDAAGRTREWILSARAPLAAAEAGLAGRVFVETDDPVVARLVAPYALGR